jgi:hypothetical protein
MRCIKIVTTLDREPNYLSDLWVKHHLQYFTPDCFIFSLNLVEPHHIQKLLYNRYGIESDIITDINKLTNSSRCVVYKNPNSNISNYIKFIDYSSDQANIIQNKLITDGIDVVIWLDIDELLYHDNLTNVLQTFSEDIIRPKGIEIVQQQMEEPYNPVILIKDQRKKIHIFPSKNKPIVTRRQVKWIPGRHACDGHNHGDHIHERDLYPGLYLIHLDKLDIDLLFNLQIKSYELYNNTNHTTHITNTNIIDFNNKIDDIRSKLINGHDIISKLLV